MTAMKRRTVLQGFAYTALYGSLAMDVFTAAEAMEPAEIAGNDPDLHLLRRVSFGPTVAELARVKAIGRTAYIEEQLAASDGQTELLTTALYPLINTGGASAYLSTGVGFAVGTHQLHLQSAMLYRALFSTAQLKEVMVDFWNDHFNTYIRKNPIPLKLDLDRDVIRPNALGNFKTLLRAVVHSGEMLHYLDNWLNRVGAINENYSRELLELHTLGKGGGYTEADLKALARILSGLGFVTGLPLSPVSYGTVQFNAAQHDATEKTFLGVSFPAGGGEAEIDRALQLMLDHPGTAHFIAVKLCRRFVADEPPAALVDRVAAAFTSSGGDIKAMLRLILNSPEFAASHGAKQKRPLEAMVGAMRACGINSFDAALNTKLFGTPVASPKGTLFTGLVKAGHEPFGWVPPNGYPDVAAYWGSSNSLLYQQKFLVGMVEGIGYGRVLADPQAALLNGNSVASGVAKATTPRAAVNNAIANLLFTALPAPAVSAAVAFVAQEADPDAVMAPRLLEQRVKGLVFVLLSSPWFLLR